MLIYLNLIVSTRTFSRSFMYNFFLSIFPFVAYFLISLFFSFYSKPIFFTFLTTFCFIFSTFLPLFAATHFLLCQRKSRQELTREGLGWAGRGTRGLVAAPPPTPLPGISTGLPPSTSLLIRHRGPVDPEGQEHLSVSNCSRILQWFIFFHEK